MRVATPHPLARPKPLPPPGTPTVLTPFVAPDGRLKNWPVKRRLWATTAAYLARRFEPGREYTEREVNEILQDAHTFADHALLRRMLCDLGYLARERDGSRYWLVTPPPEALP
jgi:hypothetical protein